MIIAHCWDFLPLFSMSRTSRAMPPTAPVQITINDGQVIGYTRFDGKVHHITCDLCGLDVVLNHNANPQSLISHRDSKNCKKLVRMARHQTAQDEIAAIRLSIATSTENRSQPFRANPSPVTPASFTPTPSTPNLTSSIYSPTFPFMAGLPPETPIHSSVSAASGRSTPIAGLSRDEPQINALCSSMTELRQEASPHTYQPVSARSICECPGARVEWVPGSVWSTYPYHRHLNRDFPWEPTAIENEHFLRIRADGCTRILSPGSTVCGPCTVVVKTSKFQKVVDRATEAATHTQQWALTHAQLLATLRKVVMQYRELRTKVRSIFNMINIASYECT